VILRESSNPELAHKFINFLLRPDIAAANAVTARTTTTNAGARKLLLQGERQKFLAEEWPRVHQTIQRLGLTPEELLDAAKEKPKS